MPTHTNLSFEAERDDLTGQYRLVANPGGQVVIEPTEFVLRVVDQRDFNGDSVVDALVLFDGGGNCCPSVYMFISIRHGRVHVAPLEAEWAHYSFIESDGRLVVVQKQLHVSKWWRLDGIKAVLVKEIPKLGAETEIEGEGPHYDGPLESKVLNVDLNGDGVVDAIECRIWRRWGSLSCVLPLPDGKVEELDFSCDRIGVLSSARNGYRELVCNNDTLIVFNGIRWMAE